jgi:hypothetical protein
MLLTLESKAKLNNGVEIPYLGLGVYQSPPGRTTAHAVRYALKIGYRYIDTTSCMATRWMWVEQYRKVESEGTMSSSLQRFATAIKDMILPCTLAKEAYDA